MAYLFPNNFSFTDKHIIDWYDGAVTALVRINENTEWCFVSLLAWNQRDKEKVFAIFPLDEKYSDELVDMLSDESGDSNDKKHWDVIKNKIIDIAKDYQGNVGLIRCNEIGKSITALKNVDINEINLRSQIGCDVENTLSPDNIKEWFELIGN